MVLHSTVHLRVDHCYLVAHYSVLPRTVNLQETVLLFPFTSRSSD